MRLLTTQAKEQQQQYGQDFLIISDANYRAYLYLNKWPAWHGNNCILWGEEKSSKTSLARYFAKLSKAIFIDLYALASNDLDVLLKKNKHFIIDDFEKYFERKSVLRNLKNHNFKDLEQTLLHIINHATEHNKSVLFLANQDVERIAIKSADLHSRIQACNKFCVTKPSAEALFSYVEERNIAENLQLSAEQIKEIIKNCQELTYQQVAEQLESFVSQ